MATILIVEDNVEFRNLVQEYLEFRGYTVRTAGDCPGALADIKQDPPDLVLLDIGLPRISGLRLLEMLAEAGLSERMKVILLTGRREKKSVLRAIELGAHEYLTKPFRLPDLIRRIEKYLGQKTLAEVTDLMSSLENSSPQETLETELLRLAEGAWTPYPAQRNGRELCLFLPKGRTPGEIRRLPVEELSRVVRLYEKIRLSWKLLWPVATDLPTPRKKVA